MPVLTDLREAHRGEVYLRATVFEIGGLPTDRLLRTYEEFVQWRDLYEGGPFVKGWIMFVVVLPRARAHFSIAPSKDDQVR